jgi:hypothetical protein
LVETALNITVIRFTHAGRLVKSMLVPLVEATAVACTILCNCALDALLSVPKNCPLYSRLPVAGVPISVSEVKASIDMVKPLDILF